MLNRKFFVILISFACVLLPALAGAKKFTLVIDAGHGGKDAGAVGATSKEKNLTLKYALAFGEMVERNCPDVKVVYTRKTDRFLELWQRAEIANNHKADLFISVHINAVPKGRTARGFQTYTLGRGRTSGSNRGFVENLEVAKRENSVILLEKDYKQTYHGYDPNSPESDIMFEFIQDDNMVSSVQLAKAMQKHVCAATGRQDQGAHQDNLAVLRLTSMPGCLVELGFISTPDEERFLNAASSTEKYARGMFNAFQAYRKKNSGGAVAPAPGNAPVASDETPKGGQPKTEKTANEQPRKDTENAEPAKNEPAKSETAKPESATSAKSEQSSGESASDDAPVFKVQFLTSATKLKNGAKEFKGLQDVDSYKEKGLWKYTVGSAADYDSIRQLRRQVAEKFPQAFVVAFRNGVRMDLEQAKQEYRSRKK